LERETDAIDASNDVNGEDIDHVPVQVPVPRPLQHIIDVAVKASTKDKASNALKHFEVYASQHFGKIIYNRLQNKSRSHRNTYSCHKAAIGCILKFASRYPSEKPTDPNQIGKWEGDLSQIANKAILKANANLKLLRKENDHDKMFVITDLVKLGLAPFVVGQAWPLGMPEGAIQLFNKQTNGKD
jgi:hypothetical protein